MMIIRYNDIRSGCQSAIDYKVIFRIIKKRAEMEPWQYMSATIAQDIDNCINIVKTGNRWIA